MLKALLLVLAAGLLCLAIVPPIPAQVPATRPFPMPGLTTSLFASSLVYLALRPARLAGFAATGTLLIAWTLVIVVWWFRISLPGYSY